jgi:hypothetical protein
MPVVSEAIMRIKFSALLLGQTGHRSLKLNKTTILILSIFTSWKANSLDLHRHNYCHGRGLELCDSHFSELNLLPNVKPNT